MSGDEEKTALRTELHDTSTMSCSNSTTTNHPSDLSSVRSAESEDNRPSNLDATTSAPDDTSGTNSMFIATSRKKLNLVSNSEYLDGISLNIINTESERTAMISVHFIHTALSIVAATSNVTLDHDCTAVGPIDDNHSSNCIINIQQYSTHKSNNYCCFIIVTIILSGSPIEATVKSNNTSNTTNAHDKLIAKRITSNADSIAVIIFCFILFFHCFFSLFFWVLFVLFVSFFSRKSGLNANQKKNEWSILGNISTVVICDEMYQQILNIRKYFW